MTSARSFCLVSTFYPPANFGGDGLHVQRLARGLVRRGHRVRVIHNPFAHTLMSPGRGRRTATEDDEDEEIEVIGFGDAFDTAATYLAGGPPPARRRELGRLLAGFDVVHFHNPSLLGGPRALDLGDGIRLYTTHEHWLVCPTHVLFRNGREVCTRRTCLRCTLIQRRPPQPWRATGLLSEQVAALDALLCPSRFTAAVHRTHFPDARLEVVPLPAPDVAEVASLPDGLAPDRPFFLFAGRLEPIKGADRLIEAFGGVRGADLVIAGTGSEADELERLAAGDRAIRFIGRQPQSVILGLCRRARAVVVPSVGYETFGGAALEAMAMGTAAVVRDLGPLPELVEEGGGIVFADDDALVAVLQHLVDDADAARRLGERGQAIAKSRFGEQRFFARYEHLVDDLAAPSPRAIHGPTEGEGT